MNGQIFIGDDVGSFLMEVKRPNKIRFEVEIGGTTVTKTYDGKAAWKLSSPGQTPQSMTENEAKQFIGESDIDGPFLDFKTKGSQIEIVDKDMLGPSLVWKLKVTQKEGGIDYYYVESTGYLILLREELSGNGGQQLRSRQFYQNFQRVQSISFPFTIVAENSNYDEPIKLEMEKVELNVPEDDNRFSLSSSK